MKLQIKNATAAATTAASEKVDFFPKSTTGKTPSLHILHHHIRRVAHQSAAVACLRFDARKQSNDSLAVAVFPLIRLMNARRKYMDSLLDGAPEIDGSFYGDGIPRTAGGIEFEPLSWGDMR